ncbi:MAG: OmpA family protein, partial [Pikeienuella sp.]
TRDRDRWRDRDRDRWRGRDRDRHRHRNRDGDGLSDWEMFGLGALSAVAVGAVIYGAQEVLSNDGERIVTRDPQGDYHVYRDDDALIRRAGSTVSASSRDDGLVASVLTHQDGTRVHTLRDADGRVLSRRVERPNAAPVTLFDDTAREPAPPPATPRPRSPVVIDYDERTSPDLLYGAFDTDPPAAETGRYSLSQIRDEAALRYLAPEISLASVAFPSGSAAMPPDDAASLAPLGDAMRYMIERDASEVFLIEGHSDAPGDGAANLLLSDRRAESVARTLTANFGVPAENIVFQGYGESDMRERTTRASEVNRRVVIRRITPLLAEPPAG